MSASYIQISNFTAHAIDMEYDVERIMWRSVAEREKRHGSTLDQDRGTSLLLMMCGEFKEALRAMHHHVILSNALRKRQNLAQIHLFVGYGGGFSEILAVDDIVAEVIKEGAAGDGDLKILCHWNIDQNGRTVFPHQPGRLMEVERVIKLVQLQQRAGELIALANACAAEADQKGGTWLRTRGQANPASVPR